MDSNVVEGLRKRYSSIHPFIFHRSVEYAKNITHLFDILESMPKKFPIVWDDDSGAWITCRDITLSKKILEQDK